MFGLGMLKGLSVTMRHFVESYLYDRKLWERRYNDEWLAKHQAIEGKGLFTIQYPEQKRDITENFRFLPMLVYEESQDSPRCTACGICARVCPPQCIWIQRATDERGRPKAQPAGFWIDATICMSCGYCAEFCPFDAIKMNQEHETVTTDRDRDMFFDLEKLLVPVDYYAELHPTDFAAEEEVRRAKEEAKRKAAEAKKAAAAKKAEPKAKAEAEAKAVEKAVEKPAPPAKPDDLKKVEGIGPKISGILQDAGITTFAQLSDMDEDRINKILEEADPKLLRLAHPASWPQQARLATAGKWDELEELQKTLKRGRET